MVRLIWTVSVHTRYFLRRYIPTNFLLDVVRTRRGLKWGIPAMLLIRARVRESVTTRREQASLPSDGDDSEKRAAVDAIGIR